MKKEDIGKNGEPKLEEVGKFHYVKGSICRLDREESPEEQHQETVDRTEKGQCPNCGRCDITDFAQSPDGKRSCKNCGLALTPAVRAKYGI